jgi:hypothetical protein
LYELEWNPRLPMSDLLAGCAPGIALGWLQR